MNANKAIAAADNRGVHLSNLMLQAKCEIPKKELFKQQKIQIIFNE